MSSKLLMLSLILAIGISSCAIPTGNRDLSAVSDAPRAWFDAPLPGTVFYPPNPCMIVGHGASPGGIAVFELTINGTAVSVPSPDSQSSLVTLTRECGVTDPGEYVLQLRAQDNDGNWSGYAETRFIIAGREEASPAPPTAQPRPTLTPQPVILPTPTNTAPVATISIEELSTNLAYVGASSCGPVEVTLTARAIAPKGITVVVLFYRFETGSSAGGFESIAMDPIGGDLYRRTLNLSSLFGGSIPFDAATLQYQVIVQQTDGDTSLRTPVIADVSVRACGSAAPSCSSYTTRQSCIQNGCRWVGSGANFTCQP